MNLEYHLSVNRLTNQTTNVLSQPNIAQQFISFHKAANYMNE